MKLKVGDTVHWTDINHRSGGLQSGTVTKVGSKLLTVGRRVFRLDTMRTNDNYGHQTLVLDAKIYEEEQQARKLSHALSNFLSRNKTEPQKLKEIEKILGITA